MYLVDTNVVSEIRKRDKANKGAWRFSGRPLRMMWVCTYRS